MRGLIARSRLASSLTVTAVIALAAIGLSGSAYATHTPAGTTLWGYEAAVTGARILQYDVGTDTPTSDCTPSPTGNGRGLAFDPVDGNLWYTFVDTAFTGDGFIHKTTPGCVPAGFIPFGDGPGGLIQDAVGALDIDPDDGNIWAAGYQPIGGNSVLYKVNRLTGAVLASCTVPFQSGTTGEGNDTLTEAKLSGLPGSGSYLLTDAGEITTSPNNLLVVDEASCVGGGPGTVVTKFTKAVGMTGIDYELNRLFATDGAKIVSLGGQPFASVVATMSASPTSNLEDITLKVGGTPTRLVLTPLTDTNTVGTQHCVTATVTDTVGNPVPGVTVRFSVSGSNTASGSAVTNASGQAQFCYTGTVAGADAIAAFADTNNDGTLDPGEPTGGATKVWTPGTPKKVVVTPLTATNTVGQRHCVTATVTDAFGNPVPGVTVFFTVPTSPATGANPSSGMATTDNNGQAQFCWTAALPGEDTVRAVADANGNGPDPTDPEGAATKTWILPPSTEFCEVKVTEGGWIYAMNDDRANFGGNAKVQGGGALQGQEEYQDNGPTANMNVHSTKILALTCTPEHVYATIWGEATINGSGTWIFRIDVSDMGEPGTNDTYGILLSNGYDSGQQKLQGGNVQIHKT